MSETTAENSVKKYLRFPLIYRIEHWTFAISFIILGITGLIQKFYFSPISQALIGFLGSVENVRIIHRVSATVMMVSTVYHIGALAYRIYVQRSRLHLLPTLEDAKAAVQAFMYNLGRKDKMPQEGRYTFSEKMEYWAVVWGTVVMAVTGFMLWNPIATARFFPGEWIPAAKAAHGGEALLAVLAIIIWHFYGVLVRTFNKSMFTGYLSEEQMAHEHPIELADIKSGIAKIQIDPVVKKRRERTFFPVYGVVAVALLFGVYQFVTFEQTAIKTVPPAERDVVVFSPLTPTPLPTPRPTATTPPVADAATWETGFDPLFQQKCSACHGAAALGGLNITSYADLLKGGNSGPGFVPGDPDNSVVVQIQEAGGHPGALSPDEITSLREWIAAGAPEK